jgi:hypothetical protein
MSSTGRLEDGRIPLVLHVGPHKTGTTSIQYAAAQFKSVLAQQGILYPESIAGAIYPKSHNDVALLIAQGETGRVESYTDGLLAETGDSTTVFMSAEEFSPLFNSDHFGRFLDRIDPFFAVSMVYVKRRLDTLITSNVVHLIAERPDFFRRYRSLEQYIEQFADWNSRRERFFQSAGARFLLFEELLSDGLVKGFFDAVFGFCPDGAATVRHNEGSVHDAASRDAIRSAPFLAGFFEDPTPGRIRAQVRDRVQSMLDAGRLVLE